MSGEGFSRPGENGAGYFSGTDNRFRETANVCLAAAANLTASAAGPEIEIGDKGTLRLTLDVTAHTGGGDTLDITLQTSKDKAVADPWRSIGTFTQAVGVTSEAKSFSGADRFVRYNATLAGAGVDVTFTIDGEAV